MDREALEALSHTELVSLALRLAGVIAQQGARIAELTALVDRQAAHIEKLEKRVAELEAKLGKPPKTPNNSSMPPSAGQKPNLPERKSKGRKGRPGVSRALAENPDRVVEALAEHCPHCTGALTEADQAEVHAYDHIDIPPIRPDVTRINRHRGVCPHCARRFSAPAPEGMEPGSPFGPGIQALVIHLHVTQAISFERLVEMLHDVFGLTISEGAIANILWRAQAPLCAHAARIGEEVRQAAVVASDETSARVGGRKWWQWVLHSSTAIYHVIADTRAASVITDFLAGARPEVWVADRYAAQNGHAEQRQVCLAHLLRDAQYAIDSGDNIFAPEFKTLLKRACNIGRRRDRLKDTTLREYALRLERKLSQLLGLAATHEAGKKLVRAIKKCRGDLFIFVTRRDVPYTNNGSERALRMSVIFRKVTGCFRSTWGAQFYAATVSVIATSTLHGKSALQAIAEVITPSEIQLPLAHPPHPGPTAAVSPC
jgi:transposase